MDTQPQLPEGEAPFDARLLGRLIDSLPDNAILVGGQALGFWMHRYGVPTHGAAVSNDADVIGNLSDANELARKLGARVAVPKKTARTSLVAQVRIPVGGGKEANVDVLHMLFTNGGLRKSGVFTQRVIAGCVVFDFEEGQRLRVMEPFDVLESRVQNAAGLVNLKGKHVLTQARWAVEVAKVALFSLASGTAEFQTRLGAKIQRVYRLAVCAPGFRLFREHGLDVLDAIDADMLEAMAPACAPQLIAVRREQSLRHDAQR